MIIDPRLDDQHAQTGDFGPPQPDELLAIAAEHRAEDDLEPTLSPSPTRTQAHTSFARRCACHDRRIAAEKPTSHLVLLAVEHLHDRVRSTAAGQPVPKLRN